MTINQVEINSETIRIKSYNFIGGYLEIEFESATDEDIIGDSVIITVKGTVNMVHNFNINAGITSGTYTIMNDVVWEDDRYGFADGIHAKTNYGGAIGADAESENGGAVGENSYTKIGGAVGKDAYTRSGGAVGFESESDQGGSVGYDAKTYGGGAVGHSAESAGGFSGGELSLSYDGGAVGRAATTIFTKDVEVNGNKIEYTDGSLSLLGAFNDPSKIELFDGKQLIDESKYTLEVVTVLFIKKLVITFTGHTTYPDGKILELRIKYDGGAVGKSAESYFGGGAVGENAISYSGGAVGSESNTLFGGAVGRKSTSGAGGAVGANSRAGYGGAVGANATAGDGFSGGLDSLATTGGAVGSGAKETSGGFSGGLDSSATTGGAVGSGAKETSGGFSGGENSISGSGGAVGCNTYTSTGGAVGHSAETYILFSDLIDVGYQSSFTVDCEDFPLNFMTDYIIFIDGDWSRQLSSDQYTCTVTYVSKGKYTISIQLNYSLNDDGNAVVGDYTITTGMPISIAFLTDGFAGGYMTTATNGGAVGSRAKETSGGGAVGKSASAITGGAVGFESQANFGGAVGESATTVTGGAVGKKSHADYGGSVGENATATSGGAVGSGANESEGGFSGGESASSTTGAAVGARASALSGFAGGRDAVATASKAVQLGPGTNSTENTLQYLSWQLLNASGLIPNARYSTVPLSKGGTGATTWASAINKLTGGLFNYGNLGDMSATQSFAFANIFYSTPVKYGDYQYTIIINPTPGSGDREHSTMFGIRRNKKTNVGVADSSWNSGNSNSEWVFRVTTSGYQGIQMS